LAYAHVQLFIPSPDQLALFEHFDGHALAGFRRALHAAVEPGRVLTAEV
jgi:hypothetical protein